MLRKDNLFPVHAFVRLSEQRTDFIRCIIFEEKLSSVLKRETFIFSLVPLPTPQYIHINVHFAVMAGHYI